MVVEYLVKTRHALLGRHSHDEDGDHVGRELEYDGGVHAVGQRGHHIKLVSHVVRRHIDVGTVLELKGYDRDVLLRS